MSLLSLLLYWSVSCVCRCGVGFPVCFSDVFENRIFTFVEVQIDIDCASLDYYCILLFAVRIAYLPHLYLFCRRQSSFNNFLFMYMGSYMAHRFLQQ